MRNYKVKIKMPQISQNSGKNNNCINIITSCTFIILSSIFLWGGVFNLGLVLHSTTILSYLLQRLKVINSLFTIVGQNCVFDNF